jgi:probable addiction module antidote protein
MPESSNFAVSAASPKNLQALTVSVADEGARPLPVAETNLAAGLASLLEAGDTAALVAALGEAARMRGMTEVARKAGLTREALYRGLRADAHPRFDTIVRVCAALGVKLTLQPDETAESGRSRDGLHIAGGPFQGSTARA